MWDLITWPFRLLTSGLAALVGLLLFGLWVYCVYDCATRRFRDPNYKTIWLIALVVSIFIGLGPLASAAYLIFGRQQAYRY